MQSLRELQSGMMSLLMGGSPDGIIESVNACGIPAADRLRIYRRSVIENYTASLRSSYPVIASLVGEDYFRDAARQLHALAPSRSGDLANVGETFPEFLLARHHAQQYRYFADVARLEWLCQKTRLAADPAPLDAARLALLQRADYAQLHFVLSPALNLFESPYPCLEIWQSHVDDSGSAPGMIDLEGGGVRMAIALSDRRLCFHALSESEFAFLAACGLDEPLETAIDSALAHDPAFDAAGMLQRAFRAHLVVDFRLGG